MRKQYDDFTQMKLKEMCKNSYNSSTGNQLFKTTGRFRTRR